jgi:hypothetical protein
MTYSIKTVEDLRWFLAHTQGFRGGQITDIHLSKRRIFDEESRQDVLAGSTATVVVRYAAPDVHRIAKLTLQSVSDLCIFEQDEADCSLLSTIQVELNEGKLRFWFDPQAELYVVCEEALLEEISVPQSDADRDGAVGQWTFQADSGEAPTVGWLLDQLDRAGSPCFWKASGPADAKYRSESWEGQLVARADEHTGPAVVQVQLYGPIDGAGFGMRMRLAHRGSRSGGRLLNLVAEVVTQSFSGTCLMGDTVFSHEEWAGRRS